MTNEEYELLTKKAAEVLFTVLKDAPGNPPFGFCLIVVDLKTNLLNVVSNAPDTATTKKLLHTGILAIEESDKQKTLSATVEPGKADE